MEEANQKSRGKGEETRSLANAAANTRRRHSLLIGFLIFSLALIVRFIYLYESSANPSFKIPLVDAASYDKIAGAFADGKGMDYNFFWQPFFYQFFLSVIYFVSGSSIVFAKIIQALVGALTCALTYKLGQKIFNRAIGVIAGVILALYGPMVFFESELLATGWAALWMVVVTLLFLEAGKNKKGRHWLALGICGGLSIITRPTFLPFFVAGCVWLCVKFRKDLALLGKRLALLFIGFLIITVPVTSAAKHVTGQFSLLPTSGGLNLYIGNNPDSCETLITRPGDDWIELIDLPFRYGVPPEKHDLFFRNLVIKYAIKQPIDFARGLGRKTIEFISSREIPRNVDIYVFTEWSGLLRLLVWKAGKFGFPFGVLFPLAVLGLVYRRRQIPPPVILALLFYPFSIILVFISGRYRAPMIPVFAILAAAGLVTVGNMAGLKRWKSLAVMATLAAGMVLLSSLPGPFCEENLDYKAEFYLYLGLTREMNEEGSVDELIEYYREALRIKPNYPEAHRSLALALMEQENQTDAFEHLREAIRLKPDYHKVYNDLGLLLMQQGRLDKAIEYYTEAMRLKSGYPEANHNLALALVQQDNLDEAIELFQKALKSKPRYPEAHNSLGVVLMRKGRLTEAIQHYQEALSLKSNYPEAHYNLGLALIKQNKLTEALEHLEKALQFKPDYPEALQELGNAFARLGRTNEAIKQYKEAIKLRPDYPDAYYNLALTLAQQNKLTEAAEYCKKAINLRPEHPESHNILGVILTQTGEIEEAIRHYKKALELKADYPRAHINLGSALMQTGEMPQAIEHFENALRLDKNLPGIKQHLAAAHGKYGTILIRQNKLEQAVAQWTNAIQLDDSLIAVHNNLGLNKAVNN